MTEELLGPVADAADVVVNAVVDALWHLGVRHIDIPITPPKVWKLLRENGVTYNVYGDPRGTDRPWELDPVQAAGEREPGPGVRLPLRQLRHPHFDPVLGTGPGGGAVGAPAICFMETGGGSDRSAAFTA